MPPRGRDDDGWVDDPQPAQAPPDDGWVDDPQPPQGAAGGQGQPNGTHTSKLDALLMGVAQGATLGYSDEIAGALGSAISHVVPGMEPRSYADVRDAARGTYQIARAEHPWMWGGGELAGGIGGGAGAMRAASRVRGMTTAARQAAAAGGVAGLGYSEAELRPSAATPASVGQAAVESATGAAIGGATTKLFDKVFRGARERVMNRAMDDITSGATKKLRNKLVGEVGKDREVVMGILRANPDLAREAAKAQPKGAYEKTVALMSGLSQKREEAYSALDQMGVKADPTKYTAWLASEAAKMASKAGPRAQVGEKLFKLAEEIETKYGAGPVPLTEIRQLATDLGKSAFAKDPGLPDDKLASQTAKMVQRKIVDILHQEIESAPQLKGDQGKIASDTIRALNKETQKVKNIQDALLDRATREATGSTRWKRTLAQHALSEDIFNTNLPKAAAKIVWGEIGKPALNATDMAIARLMDAAPKSTLAQLTQMAMGLGLSGTLARQAWEWSRRTQRGDQPSSAGFDRW